MWVSDKWQDYELIDCSERRKAGALGELYPRAPGPAGHLGHAPARQALAYGGRQVHPQRDGGGAWDKRRPARELADKLRGAHLQHQAHELQAHGHFPGAGRKLGLYNAQNKVGRAGRISVLNLFAYTGAATVAALAAGASVCHVDAAKGMVAWAKENAAASGVADRPVRWIVDDCAKFVEREIRRGRRYDAIIMDPPSYGRGPGGEVWKLEDSLWGFVQPRRRRPERTTRSSSSSIPTPRASPPPSSPISARASSHRRFGGRRGERGAGPARHGERACTCPPAPPAAGSRRAR